VKQIIVKTQAELDALPGQFTEYTQIIIENSKTRIVVVKARENSSVEARGNSSVVARGNSSVEAWGNSSVEAWENSSVEARENSVVRVFSALIKLTLHGFSVAFLPVTINLNIAKKSDDAHIQIVKEKGWFERNCVEKTEMLTLYKRVSSDFKTQEGTRNETLWSVGSKVTHPKWKPEASECGEGKFHACSRPYFCDEFRTTRGDRYVAVQVALADTHEWTGHCDYPHKIAFREGIVLYECDRFGKEIKRKATAS